MATQLRIAETPWEARRAAGSWDHQLPAWSDDPDPGERREKLRFRTVWISDIHLGTSGCNADLLVDFLKSVECETLYLVGDIIDFWRLKRGWYWPPRHNDVVRRILKMAKKGTRVVYIPGNHDEAPSAGTDGIGSASSPSRLPPRAAAATTPS